MLQLRSTTCHLCHIVSAPSALLISKPRKRGLSKGKVGYPCESTRDTYQHLPPVDCIWLYRAIWGIGRKTARYSKFPFASKKIDKSWVQTKQVELHENHDPTKYMKTYQSHCKNAGTWGKKSEHCLNVQKREQTMVNIEFFGKEDSCVGILAG